MEMLRAFVGCLLDLQTTRRVLDLGRAVRRQCDARGVRATWVPPANLHVTLKFLGEIDAGLAPALGDALAQVAKRYAAPRVSVRGLSSFGGAGVPRVLFAQIDEGGERLVALASAVEDVCEGLGLQRSERALQPHVTLARVRDWPAGLALSEVSPRGSESRTLDCGSSYVTEVSLYRSDLLRAGVEYHALSKHPLTGPPPAAIASRSSGSAQ